MPKGKSNERSPYGFSEAGEPLKGDDLARAVREINGKKILLSFSMGKDSLAMWLYLRDKFEIYPYFLYWVPGLSFVDAALDYYEHFFDCKIKRLPHPLFYKMLRTFAYQTPGRISTLASMQLPDYDYADIDDLLADELELETPFCAVGMRSADNMQRRNLISQMGALGFKRRRYYMAVWDWNIEDVSNAILQSGAALPIDYKYWGRTIAAFDYQYLKPLKDNFPSDYQKILEWFPLLEAELFRYEQVGQH